MKGEGERRKQRERKRKKGVLCQLSTHITPCVGELHEGPSLGCYVIARLSCYVTTRLSCCAILLRINWSVAGSLQSMLWY